MPIYYSCTDHDDWSGTNLSHMIRHLDGDHPGLSFEEAKATVIVRERVNQVHAQQRRRGEPKRTLRIMACRVCADEVRTYDDERPPYCDRCLSARTP